MTSARSFVHLLAGHRSIFHSGIYNIDSLLNCLNGHLHKFLDKDLPVILLTNLQIFTFVWVKQVLDLVLIYLIKTQVNMPLEQQSLFLLLLKVLQHKLYGLWDDPLTFGMDVLEDTHGMRLSGTCLTIYEIGSIISVQNVVAQRQTSLLKNLVLICRVLEDVVKTEFFWSFLGDH